ncbi:MAG: succinate dehydrogenase, cytochrome b556 subunit [Alphaproteobacteria bacterium]|nr:succinate dehydrogenase, cytochrome b556 subunit [Alphaproteobacteria bacterium]
MAQENRPLSPHLQIYRPQFTSVLSILHRMTGVVLGLGALLLVYWLAAAAAGPQWFDQARSIAGSWLGELVLLGFTWALFYHLLNGIRHLFWDIGMGFELATARLTGWAVAILSLVLTGAAWAVGILGLGGGS